MNTSLYEKKNVYLFKNTVTGEEIIMISNTINNAISSFSISENIDFENFPLLVFPIDKNSQSLIKVVRDCLPEKIKKETIDFEKENNCPNQISWMPISIKEMFDYYDENHIIGFLGFLDGQHLRYIVEFNKYGFYVRR